MTDKITIERETLQAAFDALDYLGDCSDYDVTPHAWQGAKAEQVCTDLRAALAAQPAEPVALKSVHLIRDVHEVCSVLVNGRLAIRDNGDIIDHFATLDWFAAPPAPAAVPPGYVLVPIEPTQAILDAPFVGKVQPQDWHSHKRSRELMAENYRAMIAAAGDKP